MTYVPTGAAGAAAAAAAAAARRMREEEEDMTKYDSDDLDGWEFKIVRTSTRKFKDYETVRQVCDEEAKAGWEMVEKFDDYRLRFKRRTDKRAGDRHLDIDPYRTQVGISQGKIGAIIGISIAVALAVLLLVIVIVKSQ